MDVDSILQKLDTFIFPWTKTPLNTFLLTKLFCPNAVGTEVDGIKFPPSYIFSGNSCADTYMQKMQFATLGVNYWLTRLTSTPNIPLDQIQDAHSAHFIPFVMFSEFPRSWEIRLVSLGELILLGNFVSTRGVITYLMHIVLFGVYLDKVYIEKVFELANPMAFFSARLFQGVFDRAHAMNGSSMFLPRTQLWESSYDPEPSMKSIGSTFQLLSREKLVESIRDEQIKSLDATVLGNDINYYKAAADMGQSVLSKRYREYLNKPLTSGIRKVGSNIFHNITHGYGATNKKNTSNLGNDFSQSFERQKVLSAAVLNRNKMNVLNGVYKPRV